MKRKAEDVASWWFYFEQVANKTKAKCKSCNEIFDRDEHGSTTNLKKHLQGKHPDLFSNKLEGEKCKKQREEEERKTIASAKDFFKPRYQPEPIKASQPTIEQSFGLWDKDGANTIKLDRLIIEMICDDITPLSVVEKNGFRRLLEFVAPKYKLKYTFLFYF